MNVKRILRNTTPFIILSVLALLAFVYIFIVEKGGPEGTGYVFVAFSITAIGVMLAVDFLLKRVLKVNWGWIWLIEVILMLACIYWWVIT